MEGIHISHPRQAASEINEIGALSITVGPLFIGHGFSSEHSTVTVAGYGIYERSVDPNTACETTAQRIRVLRQSTVIVMVNDIHHLIQPHCTK